MGSIRDPRTTAATDVTAPDASDRASGIRLDCPPDIAVSFLAQLYSASPRLRDARLPIGRGAPGETES